MKQMNFFIAVVAIPAFALLASCGYSDSTLPFFSEKLEDLPPEFAAYKSLDEITAFGQYTVEAFSIPAKSRIEHGINKTTNNVIIEVATDIDDTTRDYVFYKLDKTGRTIDSHRFSRSILIANDTGEEQLVEGVFLVNTKKSYYTTWPLDGDTTKKPFIAVNQDLAWSAEQVDAYYQDIVKKSARLADVETWEKTPDHKNQKRIRKAYYLNKTGKWYVLYGNSLRGDYTGKDVNGTNTLFKDFTDVERSFGRYVPPGNITIPYFQRQTYSKYCAQNGGGIGCTMRYTWAGTAYYQVVVGDSVLKFKNKESLSRTDFHGKEFPAKESLLVNFAYYTNPQLSYSLLSANETLYLIKRK